MVWQLFTINSVLAYVVPAPQEVCLLRAMKETVF